MTLDEQVLLAKSHGAKLHQGDDGLWTVLDQGGTVLWFACFRDEASAAWAYCFQHGLALTPPHPVTAGVDPASGAAGKAKPPASIRPHSSDIGLTQSMWSLLLRASQSDVMIIQAADGFRALEERGLAVAEARDIGMANYTLCIALTDAGRTALATYI